MTAAREEILRRVRTALADAPVRPDPHHVLPAVGEEIPRAYLRDRSLDDLLGGPAPIEPLLKRRGLQ